MYASYIYIYIRRLTHWGLNLKLKAGNHVLYLEVGDSMAAGPIR